MKQLYLLFLLALSQLTFAQDSRLYENTWYLSHMVVDGVMLPPPDNEEMQNITLEFNQDEVSPQMITSVCNYSAGATQFGNANNFWYTDYIFSLIMCNSPENQTFENQYFSFLSEHNPDDIFNYEITETGNLRTLVLVSESSDKAIYSNQTLAARQFANSGFSIQPNPASDFIDLKLENVSYNGTTVEVYNALGAKCKSEKLQSALHRMNVGDLSAGWYIVAIKSETETFTGKFLKK